ncbi:MAG: MFS transporter [Desulfovibrio sp.]|nr:MFS transporter [Desulfovibrio sp.]
MGFTWKHRHTSLAVVFMVWLVSYLDRMVMSTAIPYIADDFNLSAGEMGVVMSAFFAGYAIFQIPGGILSDRFGARKVLIFAIAWWSLFTLFTGYASSLIGLIIIRICFGIGEGIGPAATWKSLAVWTPASERGRANSIMMSTNSLGPALAPLFVVAIMSLWGWRAVFHYLSIPGFLLCIWVWFTLYDNPKEKPGVSPEELKELEEEPTSGVAQKDLTFMQVLSTPVVWKSFLLLFFSNTVAWGYMSWLPTYLVKSRGLAMGQMGIAASLPFFAGFIGAIVSGYLMDGVLKKYRFHYVIVTQLCMALFLYLMFTAESVTTLMIFNIIAGYFCFCCVASVFSLPMMEVPKEIAGRAMGIVNTAGQLAGFLAPIVVGLLITTAADGMQNYNVAFGFLCCSNIMAAIIAFFFHRSSKPGAA